MICNFCGNDKLFYRKGAIRQTVEVYYNADKTFNEDGKNSDVFDNIDIKESKYYYCNDCNKRTEPAVNEMDELLNQFGRG